MTDNDAFQYASELLQQKSGLTGPQVRGSIRLGLKAGGLDPRLVTAQQLAVVFLRLMPERLAAQGIDANRAQSLSQEVATGLEKLANGPAAPNMFERLDAARQGA